MKQAFSKKFIITLWATILALVSCQDKSIGPSFPPEVLLSAPEQVTIEGYRFTLESFLWRDFMPSVPSSGTNRSSLMAVVTVTEMDSLSIPSYLDIPKMWVIKGRAFWEATLYDHPAAWPGLPFIRTKIADGGPKWGPHIYTTVVVGIEDHRGRSYLLRASDQWIYSTD